MKIGELSRRTGISVRMLRYYEQEGLLSPARRASGYRDYDEADAVTVRRIRMLGEAGLKLDAIRAFLPCVTDDRPDFDPCPDLLAAVRGRIDDLDARIDSLARSRQLLAGYLDRIETRTAEKEKAA